MSRLIMFLLPSLLFLTSCSALKENGQPEPTPGPAVTVSAGARVSEASLDAFVGMVSEGKVKYLLVNHVNGEYRVSYGTFGEEGEKSLVLGEIAPLRPRLFKLLLMDEFTHLTVLYKVPQSVSK